MSDVFQQSTPQDERAALAQLIRDLAVVRGPVILASGQPADLYVDMRALTLDGRAAPLVGRVMLDLVDDWDFDAVGGLTMGADPVALAMLHAYANAVHPFDRPDDGSLPYLDAFVVRDAAKTHGLAKLVEGPSLDGRRVVVVEDTSTTGGSPLTAVDAVRQAGGTVVGVAVVVDRDAGARQAIEAAGLAYRAAFNLSELV